jgi:release factor glutamine methyltransferase
LRQAGVPEPRREAGTLLAHVLGCDRTFIITHSQDEIDEESLDRFAAYVRRRGKGEPLQYITGTQQFFGLNFKVTPDVLIPRPETELLVQGALDLFADSNQAPLLCDLGTGSGCITIALLKNLGNARAIAIDISEAAIRIAHSNAKTNGVSERVDFVVSDGFSCLRPSLTDIDLIVSNPPYVSLAAFAGLQREVRDYEPMIALKGGSDGLVMIRNLIHESSQHLKRGGFLLFEIGFDQGDRLRELIDTSVWDLLTIAPDLQGIPRIVVLRKPW